MKKLFLLAVALALVCFVVSAFASPATSVTGYVSDTMCGAKGASTSHAECMKKCLAKGAQVVIVTDGDQKMVHVDNPDALKGHEGHHVTVTGSMNGDAFHVDSVKM